MSLKRHFGDKSIQTVLGIGETECQITDKLKAI